MGTQLSSQQVGQVSKELSSVCRQDLWNSQDGYTKNATAQLLLIYCLQCVGSDGYRIKRITPVLTVEQHYDALMSFCPNNAERVLSYWSSLGVRGFFLQVN